MPLAIAHNPESNKEEIARVISKGGYISEVNNMHTDLEIQNIQSANIHAV